MKSNSSGWNTSVILVSFGQVQASWRVPLPGCLQWVLLAAPRRTSTQIWLWSHRTNWAEPHNSTWRFSKRITWSETFHTRMGQWDLAQQIWLKNSLPYYYYYLFFLSKGELCVERKPLLPFNLFYSYVIWSSAVKYPLQPSCTISSGGSVLVLVSVVNLHWSIGNRIGTGVT